jgi:thymidylate synthase (FAD)
MKIVKPSVTLVHHTPDPERVIEKMGRICYQSSHKMRACPDCSGTGDNGRELFDDDCMECGSRCMTCDGAGTDIESARDFIRMILKRGHESVIEHASAGFLIVTDRGVTHEIVRHRLASYSQESTRYCNYGKEQFGGELSFVQPPLPVIDLIPKGAWAHSIETAEREYLLMLSKGVKPEIARSVLPNSLKSEIGMTANFREWRHFLRLRTSPAAHPQMREVAEMIRTELLKISAVCFEDIP